ncbi:MAG: HAD-IA family hydrolase [Actinomycetota bacterium]
MIETPEFGRIDAVFFDVGNTLLKPFPSLEEVCREVMDRFGIHPSDEELTRGIIAADRYYEERYWSDDSFWANETDASAMWASLYEKMLEEAGVDGDRHLIGRAIYDHFGDGDRWRTYEDVVPVFERLRAVGLRLALVSNWDARLAKLCFDMGLYRYLDSVLSSASIGIIKPDPHIYEVACERLRVEPGHAVHVGDHYYADVLGARSVGIHPVMIDRFGFGQRVDVPVIEDLYGLLPLLGLDSPIPDGRKQKARDA